MPWSDCRRLVPIAAGLLAGACTVGPKFVRPEVPATPAYTQESLDSLHAAAHLDVNANPAVDWWTQIGSSDLDATIHQALANNRSLAAARATLARAREDVVARAGSLYPQVTITGDIARKQYGADFLGPTTLPPFTAYAIDPRVSYLLDYTGGERRAVERQRAQADVVAFQVQAVYLSITGNVVQEALTLAAVRAQIDAVEALLGEDRKNVALVQTALDAGSATRVDLLSAQTQLANDATLLPPLRQQLSACQGCRHP